MPWRLSTPSTQVRGAGRLLEPHRVSLYRVIDQFGQVIDVLVAEKRDLAATRRFFTQALDHGPQPTELSTDRALAYPRVLAQPARTRNPSTQQCPIESPERHLSLTLPDLR
jgi:transposase-like protein